MKFVLFKKIIRQVEAEKVIIFQRGRHGLMFLFNFHAHVNLNNYRVGCLHSGK